MGDQPTPEEIPPSDQEREGLLARLSESLGEILVDSHLRPHEDLWLRVRAQNWQDAARAAKAAGFAYFGFSFGN